MPLQLNADWTLVQVLKSARSPLLSWLNPTISVFPPSTDRYEDAALDVMKLGTPGAEYRYRSRAYTNPRWHRPFIPVMARRVRATSSSTCGDSNCLFCYASDCPDVFNHVHIPSCLRTFLSLPGLIHTVNIMAWQGRDNGSEQGAISERPE
jgi:hypothetical protein